MYRNIVFDLGGVVVNFNPKDYLMEKFCHERTETKIYEAVFGSPEWELMDNGLISWEEAATIFMQRGRDKGIEFEMRTALEEWPEMMTTRKATILLMHLLKKKGFNLYYLSNISKDVLALLTPRNFWPLFDGGVASYELQVGKPELAIYQELLDRYDLVPQETIFTDDNRENASVAFQVGITGIHFKNVKSFCKMLVTYGIDI